MSDDAALSEWAEAIGKVYVAAVESGNNARALACAQQLLARLGESVPYEEEFENAHNLIINILWALQEVAAGNLDRHPILKGRYDVGGVGQLSAATETRNGIGAAVMLFLMDRGSTEDSAAKLVSSGLGVSVTAAKKWLAARKRKLLKATARPSLDRINAEFARSPANDPVKFARQWLRDQVKALNTLSPP